MKKKFTTESILIESINTFKNNFAYFSILSVIFLLLIYLSTYLLAPIIVTNQITLVLFLLILVAIYARLAVMVHRTVLLKEKSLTSFFSWSIHDTKFMLWVMGMSISFMMLLFLVILPFATAGNSGAFMVLMLILFVGIGILFSKLSLLFPSVAVGKDISISTSWQKSKGHTGSLFFLIVFLPYITNKLLNKIPDTSLIMEIILMLFTVLIVIFEVTLLSHCYEALFDEKDDDDSNDDDSNENIQI